MAFRKGIGNTRPKVVTNFADTASRHAMRGHAGNGIGNGAAGCRVSILMYSCSADDCAASMSDMEAFGPPNAASLR